MGSRPRCRTWARAGRNLVSAAQTQFGPDADQLKQALNSLQSTVAGLSDQAGVSAKLGAIAASVGAVEAAAQPIIDAVRTGCPAVPSPTLPSASAS